VVISRDPISKTQLQATDVYGVIWDHLTKQ
jgi:hypothetical protein